MNQRPRCYRLGYRCDHTLPSNIIDNLLYIIAIYYIIFFKVTSFLKCKHDIYTFLFQMFLPTPKCSLVCDRYDQKPTLKSSDWIIRSIEENDVTFRHIYPLFNMLLQLVQTRKLCWGFIRIT